MFCMTMMHMYEKKEVYLLLIINRRRQMSPAFDTISGRITLTLCSIYVITLHKSFMKFYKFNPTIYIFRITKMSVRSSQHLINGKQFAPLIFSKSKKDKDWKWICDKWNASIGQNGLGYTNLCRISAENGDKRNDRYEKRTSCTKIMFKHMNIL